MRPSTLRLLAGGIAIGAIVGAFTTATARADTVSDYADSHANEVCGGLMQYPSVPGVIASFVVAQQAGLSDVQSAQAVTRVVMDVCPQHIPELLRFVDIYTKGGGQ